MHQLGAINELKRVSAPLSPRLEITELADRVLRAGGPALLIEQPHDGERGWSMPVLANLFGTPRRVALGMGTSGQGAPTLASRRAGATVLTVPHPLDCCGCVADHRPGVPICHVLAAKVAAERVDLIFPSSGTCLGRGRGVR